MAKIVGKGSIFKATVSGTLTAIGQLLEFGVTGSAAETFKSTTIDGGVYHTYEHTGYVEPGKFDGSLYYDPGNTGHKYIATLMASPSTAATNTANACSITYTDAATTVQSFNLVGWGLGAKVVMNDGVKADISAQISGTPGWAT